MKINKKWFSLIELLIAIIIFWMVILWWFYALSSVNYWKVKLIEKTDINKEAFYFSEKLFEEIKAWWVIDFEEYFNRYVIWTNTSSWYFSIQSWYWNYWSWWTIWQTNYWDGFYYCISWNWSNMWTWWCFNNIYNIYWNSLWNKPQRYWQYSFQFIDYNVNNDNDNWDEDRVDWERWDDDDENLWVWPIVFTWWENVKELYLISWDRKKRTLFRWIWKLDPAKTKPAWSTCDWDKSSFSLAWSWCIWTIQILKLTWEDLWVNHDWTSSWSYDGIIDTWKIDKKFTSWLDIIAWSGDTNQYRQDLFWNNISVKDFKIFLYPNKDRALSFKDLENSTNINQYARIQMILTPSRKKRWSMKWVAPEIKISTTINLTDYFSK